MSEDVQGASAEPTGLSSLRDRAADGVSPVPASIPSAGQWAVVRNSSYDRFLVEIRKVAKVTPKLVKFEGSRWPRQVSHLEVVASFDDERAAAIVRDGRGGIAGEFNRRRRAADDDRSARVAAALEKARKQQERLIASAIETRRAETQSGSVHESAAAKPDAQKDHSA